MSKRASIFGDDDLDLSGFAPKPVPDATAPPAEKVRAVSESANFRSREAKTPKPQPAKSEQPKREPRRYRTGRNTQFNVKTTQATIDAFYSICDRAGWVLGEAFEYAVKALEVDEAFKKAVTERQARTS